MMLEMTKTKHYIETLSFKTLAALRQAWLEHLRIILVINKIDRLIVELKMSPLEAYYHIRVILEHLNAVVAEQYASLLFEKTVSNNDFLFHVDCLFSTYSFFRLIKM
jgi:ribosome assembly protein 1